MNLLLYLFSLSACFFQTQYHIQKIWLFSQAQYQGNVPVKAGVKLAGHSYTLKCFLQVSAKQELPAWKTVCYDGNEYVVDVSALNQDSVIAGKEKGANLPVIIKPAPGSQLIQLVLTLNGTCEKGKPGELVLTGTYHHKQVYLKYNEPVTELSPVFMP